jgi:hypothetical protein
MTGFREGDAFELPIGLPIPKWLMLAFRWQILTSNLLSRKRTDAAGAAVLLLERLFRLRGH